MDVKLEDFVITEPQATVTNGATSAKVVHFDKRNADEAIVTLERSKFKAYKQVVETAHRPVDLLFGNNEHCVDPSESDNVSSPSEALEFCAMKCQEYSSIECTAFWLYNANATVPYRCCIRSEIDLESCREPFPGVLYSVVESSRVSMKLEAPSQIPVLFKWDEIDTTIPRIELIQVLSRPVTIEDAKRFALSRGFSLGGEGYGFSGSYASHGLYAYRNGEYPGMAFFGTAGTVESKMSPLDGPTKYRPYDYAIQEIDASSLDSFNPMFSVMVRIKTNKAILGFNRRDIRLLNDKFFEVTYMVSRGDEHVAVISRRRFLDKGPGSCVIRSQSL